MKILPNTIPQIGRKYLISTDQGRHTRKYILVEIRNNDYRTHAFDCIEPNIISYLNIPGNYIDEYMKNGNIKLIR